MAPPTRFVGVNAAMMCVPCLHAGCGKGVTSRRPSLVQSRGPSARRQSFRASGNRRDSRHAFSGVVRHILGEHAQEVLSAWMMSSGRCSVRIGCPSMRWWRQKVKDPLFALRAEAMCFAPFKRTCVRECVCVCMSSILELSTSTKHCYKHAQPGWRWTMRSQDGDGQSINVWCSSHGSIC